jgi:N-acetylglucosamine-6-phosphate deacetylase
MQFTDCNKCCGLNDGDYKFAGVDITKKNKKVVLKNLVHLQVV